MSRNRIAITGMSINTPLGDSLEVFFDNLIAGKSAITRWKTYAIDNIYSKVGADLADYDVKAKLESFADRLPADMYKRLRQLVRRAPWSTGLSLLMSADAWLDAGMVDQPYDMSKVAVLVAGHNINQNYTHNNFKEFEDDPEFIEGLLALHGLDTDHAGSVSEMLQSYGPIYTMGAACASGNVALRSAVDEIRYHGNEVAVVVGAVLEFSPVDLQGMAIMGAIAHQNFNDEPQRASRPYDTQREGFVPAHGGAVLILEDYDKAVQRGARIHAEVLGVAAGADGNHLPQPSREGQAATMRRVLEDAGIAPEQVDFISAHATSTPLGDITEIASIKEVFAGHAYHLKINAPKSMLGHTCWAAPTVESVAAILQLQRGTLHPSINIENLDEEVDLDVCANKAIESHPDICMKNSFGFGGINCVSLFRRVSSSG